MHNGFWGGLARANIGGLVPPYPIVQMGRAQRVEPLRASPPGLDFVFLLPKKKPALAGHSLLWSST